MPDSVPSSNASAAAVSSYTSHTSANALDHNPAPDHAAAAAVGPGTTVGSVAVGPTSQSSNTAVCTAATDVCSTTTSSFVSSRVPFSSSLPSVFMSSSSLPGQSLQPVSGLCCS